MKRTLLLIAASVLLPLSARAQVTKADYAAYGERKRSDFFVQHLLGQRPPDWNRSEPAKTTDVASR